MSVYTLITQQQLADFLNLYNVGTLREFQGIVGGITNTNYCVITDNGKFALTLFEQNTLEELPFYFEVLTHLAIKKFPCAQPVPDNFANVLQTLQEKPAVLCEWCPGELLAQIKNLHIHEIGNVLGQMHIALKDFSQEVENPRNLRWMQLTAKKIFSHLTDDQQVLLQAELDFQQQQQAEYALLPKGIIHADLFRDNVLFLNDTVSGVLDFYYACHDYLLLDIATTLLDWCADNKHYLHADKAAVLLTAYQQQRCLSQAEKNQLNPILRLAALRYWLSRLLDFHFPSSGARVLVKNPMEYELKLRQLATFSV